MKKAIFILPLIILLNCSLEDQGIKKNPRPNIIFIMVDDLGKEWISSYGAEDIQTRNIDKLAHSGIRFNNVYGMPQCTPSRVSLLTGQYPYRHGWVNHWDVPRWGGGAHFDEHANPSLAIELKKAGYKTCIAGKWQIDDFRVEPDALKNNGFDAWCMWTGYETGNPEPSGKRYHDPYLFTQNGSKSYANEYGPELFSRFIRDFIMSNKDSSMFIYFPMALTHGPLHNPPGDTSTTVLGKHKAMVDYVDEITGDIISTLAAARIRDNTLIVWTTDNGSSRGITGTLNGRKVKGGKGLTLEAGICLPFIASWPVVIDSNQTSEALIDFTDVFPTFLDLAGIEIGREFKQNEKTHLIDGVSFKEILTQNKPSVRDWILSMGGGNNARLTEEGVENQYRFRDRVLRNERFKLYIDASRKPSAFYDLKKDPAEEVNLIDSLDTALRKENYQQLASVITSFPQMDKNPIYIPNPEQDWDVEITAESGIWKK